MASKKRQDISWYTDRHFKPLVIDAANKLCVGDAAGPTSIEKILDIVEHASLLRREDMLIRDGKVAGTESRLRRSRPLRQLTG